MPGGSGAPTHLFILSYQRLSMLEILAYLEERCDEWRVWGEREDALAVEARGLKEDDCMARVGGSFKLGKVISWASSIPSKLEEGLEGLLLHDRVRWGVSLYGIKGGEAEEARCALEEALREALRAKGIRPTKKLLPHPGREEIEYGRLGRDAVEVMAAKLDGRYCVALTVHVIDHASYRSRDLERPRLDPKLSLPPRLARALVNVAGAGPSKRLLDPFCGTGTILMEALLVGSQALGLDLDGSKVKDCKANLAWLMRREKLRGRYWVRRGDAKLLPRYFQVESIDAIATEPLLIPPLRALPSRERVNEMLDEAAKVYGEALKGMAALLKWGSRIAIVAPVLSDLGGRLQYLELMEWAEELGLEPYRPGGIRIEYPLLLKPSARQRLQRCVYALIKH